MSSHSLPLPNDQVESQNDSVTEHSADVGFRLRSDLIAVKQPLGAGEIIAVKDPMSLNYFHFRPIEWFLLEQLLQPVSVPEIQRRHRLKYPQTRLKESELKLLLLRAHRDGLLLVTNAVHVGQAIEKNHVRQQQTRRWTSIFQILAIRFKGVDPETFLDWTAGFGRILFSGPICLAVALVSLCSIFMCVGQWDAISLKLPTLRQFLVGENVIYILLALAFVKILHELGHAMACKRFGGECHEIGFMLLAFMPCLYCNVSDTWMTPNRWKRMAVSSAGIYIEIFLANLALFFWYFSYPGIFQSVCLNVVLICSLNTLLLNGNPLLRYDGYYVLSDLIEVPNLSQQSRQAFWYPLTCWLNAMPFQFRKWRIGLAVYALASMIYRMMVVVMILWFVHSVTKRWEMELLGNLVSLIVISGMLLPVVLLAANTVRTNLHVQRRLAQSSKRENASSAGTMHWFRLAILILIFGVSGWLLWKVPLPHRVTSPLVVELDQPQWVFVPVEGKIENAVAPGTEVKSGDVLAQLSNSVLEYQLNELQSRISDASVRLQQLKNRVNAEPQLAYKIPILEAEIESNRILAGTTQADINRLTIRSGLNGVVFSRRQKNQTNDSRRFLSTWSGDPLDRENRGAWLSKGEWLCLVGQPDKLRLVMPVDQSQIEFVQIGDKVRIRLDQVSDRIFTGNVESISREHLEQDGNEYSDLQSNAKRENDEKRSFRVVVSFNPGKKRITPGSTGIGKVVSDERTVGQFVTRWIQQTLRFEY